MYRHDEMTGRKPAARDYRLAEFIMQLLTAPGVTEASRTAISNFLLRKERSGDIGFALHLLHVANRARCRKLPGVKKPFELWHAVKPPRK
jgi:hypothetical protein